MHHRKVDSLKIADHFDDWVQLARENPEQFEDFRQSLIEDYFVTVPEDLHETMKRVQWRVDQEIKRSSNPTGAMVAIYRMMWEKFSLLNEKQKDLLASQGRSVFQIKKVKQNATILDFESARRAKQVEE